MNEVSPPGWSGTVKAMKKHKDRISNPWALSWYLYNKGAKPHYKPETSSSKEPEKKFETFSEYVERRELNEGNWLAGVINKNHRGFCSPVTKKTCTPHRKALALRFKKGGDLHKGD